MIPVIAMTTTELGSVIGGTAVAVVTVVGWFVHANNQRHNHNSKKIDKVMEDVTDLKVKTGEHNVKLEQIKEGQTRIELLIRNGRPA